MTHPVPLVFRKCPVSLTCDDTATWSIISEPWCRLCNISTSTDGCVYGFLSINAPHGLQRLHLCLRPVSDTTATISLGAEDSRRYRTLLQNPPGQFELSMEQDSATDGRQLFPRHQSTLIHLHIPSSLSVLSFFLCPMSSEFPFPSQDSVQWQLQTQSPWFHVTESMIRDAVQEISHPFLVALLNKIQTLMFIPLSTPARKIDAIDAVVALYHSFRTLCNVSDADDLCTLLHVSVTQPIPTTAALMHLLFSRLLGPGLCQSVLRQFRSMFAPSSIHPPPEFDHLNRSLSLLSIQALRQLLGSADCPMTGKSSKDLAMTLSTHFARDVTTLRTLSGATLLHFLLSLKPDLTIVDVMRKNTAAIHDVFLEARYGPYLVSSFRLHVTLFPDLIREPRSNAPAQDDSDWARTVSEVEQNWPSLPPRRVIHACMLSYRRALTIEAALVCCVCSRQSYRLPVASYYLQSNSVLHHCLSLLQPSDPHVKKYLSTTFAGSGKVQLIKGALLDTRGLRHYNDAEILQICKDCAGALLCKNMPRHALANNLYLGEYPSEFHDVTWAEEQLCALYRLHAYIVRIFASEEAERKLFGNTCAFPQNTVSTATALPRTPADVVGNITVVFIGSRKPTTEELLKYKHYTVRRGLVWRLLLYLHEYHLFYQRLPPPCPELISQYPEYGLLPGFEERIIWDQESNSRAVFEQESAGMSSHPATEFITSERGVRNDETEFYLECAGVTDPNLQNIPARHLEHAAISNLARPCAPEDVLTTNLKPASTRPDLIISRGSEPVNDYNNPALFPGMFPTLFPLGVGGFEDPFRPVKLQFLPQAEHFLDLATRSFRRHHTYLFAALNTHQRREVNLRTHLAISRHSFKTIAPRLNNVSPNTLDQLATRIEQENWVSNLSPTESEAMFLFRNVNTIAAKLPGSEAMKAQLRANIRAYFQFFGLAHLFFTINPSPIHSPVFQFRVGDHNVDLSTQYPILPPRHVRALRVASDPMEASDFYQWCIDLIFEYLFGWDQKKQRSRPEGGILGHLQAFYIVHELTERGFFHAHSLLWLLGAPNPDVLHQRLTSPDFQQRFFEFYESIIYNHFPDVDVTMPSSYNCSQELPPMPPAFEAIADPVSPASQRWQQLLDYETKICATDCQLHSCRPVCYKYKKDGVCRFNFPLEVVPESYYDAERKSVVMRLLNPQVNYYNPIIMTYCRHNHDIKCMLSGRANRAGMLYVSNYITKMDFKTQHALSLLSKAVAAAQGTEGSSVRQAQVLLQKCLTQFHRRQQIHAQQACRYIRGYNDALPSHQTVILLSHLLLAFVYELYPELIEEERPRDTYMPLIRDSDGRFRETSQVEDYYYRGDALGHLNFYDFVRLVECLPKTEDAQHGKPAGTSTFQYVELKKQHQRASTHQLAVRTESLTPFCGAVRVPLMVGSFPPRQSTTRYPVFAAAHFKPFGPDMPLSASLDELIEEMKTYPFSNVAQTVMKNWEAFHECEDERDAERLRKREHTTHVAATDLPRWQHRESNHDDDLTFDISSIKRPNTRLEQVGRELIATFHLANWFETRCENVPQTDDIVESPESAKIYDLSTGNIKQWLHTLTEADKAAKVHRRTGDTTQMGHSAVHDEVVNATISGASKLRSNRSSPRTTIITNENQGRNSDDIQANLIKEFCLNERQTIAFKIIASQFLSVYVHRQPTSDPPFNLLLTGPGGTGKSHVITALKALMKHYGLAHAIRFLAPTGTTASVIAGMTIHSGLKIGFKTSRIEGEDNIHVQYTTSVSNRRLLREEFKDAKVIFIDEVSLIPQELIAEVDAALREATETDQWMGGLMIIYAGDFGQYAPVGGTPLYHPIRSGLQVQSASQIKARLGRLVWKQLNAVISLSEQERMKKDAAYAAAVSRLRLRSCTPADVDLFNSRILKGPDNPTGVDLSQPPYVDKGIAIVDTNHARQMLNLHKARSAAARARQPLILCAARDCIKDKDLDPNTRDELLNMEISTQAKSDFLPGFIPCYTGMQIILRHKNLSTELGITNGAQGFIRQMKLETDIYGHTFCAAALIEFADSKVNIPGLPKKWVPILPRTCRYKVQLSNSNDQVWVTRSQLPFSPAFAVTGHSAQGKTLPVVITNLKGGGFAAYVAASRPRSRFGLVITERVTLEDLNKPLPLDLRDENERLSALEHNTLVRFGFLPGALVAIPDPEGETQLSNQSFTLSRSTSTTGAKRKHEGDDVGQSKRSKLGQTSATAAACCRALPGPVWDQDNWSCAYDAFLPSLLCAVSHHPQPRMISHLRSTLGDQWTGTLLQFATNWEQLSCSHITRLRDNLRDILFEWRPNLFPRHGKVMISASHLCELLLPIPQFRTLDGRSFTPPQLLYHAPDAPPEPVVRLEQWLLDRLPSRPITATLPGTAEQNQAPLLHFEIIPPLEVSVPTTLSVCGWSYELSSALYHGDSHYSSCFLHNGVWYSHDGLQSEGRASVLPSFPGSIMKDGKTINLVIYRVLPH